VVDVGRRLSNLLALRGVLAVLFGVVVLVWPDVTLVALALVFAVYAVVDGIGLVVSGLDRRGRGRRWSYVAAGVVGIVTGILAAVWPGLTALVLVLMVGAWAVITGVLEIAAAVQLRRAGIGAWGPALSGVVSLVAGVVVLVRPDLGALALAVLLGVFALVAGVALLWAAWELHRGRAVVLRVGKGMSALG
jgi:uncharacterized membrane protein HdeD (DUF308 family)